ncbi:MAG: ThuA domain-containing protein, partial [Gammaproteobacteria bacterium]
MTKRINAYLVCGGRYHDFDFARMELLKLLHEHENIRVRVAEDYADIETITAADFLLTYTCDVVPTEAQQQGLHQYLADGKKWFALHGTNSILEFLSMKPLKVATPRSAPLYMQ